MNYYRHVVKGGRYRVISHQARLKRSTDAAWQPDLIAYENEQGDLFITDKARFSERFEPIDHDPLQGLRDTLSRMDDAILRLDEQQR